MMRLWALLLVLSTLACGQAPPPQLTAPQWNVGVPHNGRVLPGLYLQRFTPPEDYERWYHAMERCVGAKGNYAKVMWLVAAAPWLEGQRRTLGSWEIKEGSDTPHITINAQGLQDSTLVAHEAIHDILWRSGWRRPPLPATATDTDSLMAVHPTPPFNRCAPRFF